MTHGMRLMRCYGATAVCWAMPSSMANSTSCTNSQGQCLQKIHAIVCTVKCMNSKTNRLSCLSSTSTRSAVAGTLSQPYFEGKNEVFDSTRARRCRLGCTCTIALLQPFRPFLVATSYATGASNPVIQSDIGGN